MELLGLEDRLVLLDRKAPEVLLVHGAREAHQDPLDRWAWGEKEGKVLEVQGASAALGARTAQRARKVPKDLKAQLANRGREVSLDRSKRRLTASGQHG